MHGSTGKQETSWPFTHIVGVGEVKGCIQTNGQNTWHPFGILILGHIPVNFSPRDVAQQGCVWPCHCEQELHKWNTNLLNAPFTQSVPTLIHWHYPQLLQSIPRNLKVSRLRQCISTTWNIWDPVCPLPRFMIMVLAMMKWTLIWGQGGCFAYSNKKADFNANEQDAKESTQQCKEVKFINLPNEVCCPDVDQWSNGSNDDSC